MNYKVLLSACLMLVAASAIAGQRVSNQFSLPSSPELDRRVLETSVASDTAWREGVAALTAKIYFAAEQDFRAALSAEPNGSVYLGLGEALAAQGKTAEAMQAYWMVFHPPPHNSWGGSYMARANLEYALLLNQSGQWTEAVAHYEAALPQLPRSEISIKVQFDPAVYQPVDFEAAARVGLGWDASYVGNGLGIIENDRAFAEFTKAKQLKPDSPLTNYYYGQGWQKLSPTERKQFGTAQQAKAALQKAVNLGKGDVKQAAAKALKNFS